MCGIGGLVLKDGERIQPALLERMARDLAHRGPDAQGLYIDERHGNLGAAHRRLKIIDLSDEANQPMFNEDGRVGVVFNGEIYNFRELRAELERAGHRFRCQSDTEVLVHGFEEWGTGAFARLNGIFAIGLWDLRGARPVVYLARDRVGAKPLFYSLRDQRLAFASELKPLLGLPWVGRAVDREALFLFLKHSHVPHPHSIVEDVRQVEPGHWLCFRDGELSDECYWDPSALSATHPPDRTESQWLAELDSALLRSVDQQLVADVPVGCFLSGGIDSSLLVAAFGELRSEALRTFSIGYHESRYDETPFARQIAGLFGCRHHELIVAPGDFHDLIPSIPELVDQPLADPTLLSTLLLCRFARREVTVSLSGDGGDELFFGYEYHELLYRLRALSVLPRSLRSTAFSAIQGVLESPAFSGLGSARLQQLAKLAAILQYEDEAQLLQYFVGTVGPLRLDRLAGLLAEPAEASGMSRQPAARSSAYAPMLRELSGLPWPERIAQVFFRTFLPDTVLAKTDRASMAFGLEARVPMLDNRMLELSARLPFAYKYRGGSKKYLLRQLLSRKIAARDPSGRLAGEISRRRKQGFSIPLREWLRGDLRYLLDEYLSVPRLRREGIFAAERVHELVRAHLRSQANHSHLLWSLVTFQMWKERWLP